MLRVGLRIFTSGIEVYSKVTIIHTRSRSRNGPGKAFDLLVSDSKEGLRQTQNTRIHHVRGTQESTQTFSVIKADITQGTFATYNLS